MTKYSIFLNLKQLIIGLLCPENPLFFLKLVKAIDCKLDLRPQKFLGKEIF